MKNTIVAIIFLLPVSAISQTATYDSATNLLTLPELSVGSKTLYNLRVKIKDVEVISVDPDTTAEPTVPIQQKSPDPVAPPVTPPTVPVTAAIPAICGDYKMDLSLISVSISGSCNTKLSSYNKKSCDSAYAQQRTIYGKMSAAGC